MFRVGLTRDFLNPNGTLGFGDISLDLLDGKPGISYEFLSENARELSAKSIRDYEALAVLAPRINAATLKDADRLAVIARYGVGYDSVDVAACTAQGVALTITPDGVRRPVAAVVMTFLLTLTHRLFDQDRALRAGEGWSRKFELMGYGLTGKKLGLIGLGNIGSEVVRLAEPFDLKPIAHDPYVDPARAAELGVELVDLESLLSTADYVVVLCALTPETHHLLNAERLGLMKPSAFLINTARGSIVDQIALTKALTERRIRGAALDVYEQEPVDPNDPLFALDNVIATPHALCWTDEWAYLTGRSAMESILAIAAGNVPKYVVNKEVVDVPAFQAKLRRFRDEQEGR